MCFMLSSFACVYIVLYLLALRIIFIVIVTVAVPHVCVSVHSFLPPRASISRNIGTYVFTATRKTLYIAIIIDMNMERLKSC